MTESSTIYRGVRWPTLGVETTSCSGLEIVGRITALARERKVLWFDLGDLDVRQPSTARALEELSRLRREHLYGLSFRGRVATILAHPQAQLLANAGVRVVELVTPADSSVDARAPVHTIRQVQTVRALHAVGIDVSWTLGASSTDESEEAELAAMTTQLHHLPPPAARAGDSGVLSDAIAAWRKAHTPWTLTYARGVNFLRIRDRRAGTYEWTFATLTARQADAFLFCDEARAFEDVAAHAPAVPKPKLRSFLDSLVARNLMCRAAHHYYQALPIRRRLEERWTTADY